MLRCFYQASAAVCDETGGWPSTSFRCCLANQPAEHSFSWHCCSAIKLPCLAASTSAVLVCMQGTGFPHSERERLGLRGLLPHRQLTPETQVCIIGVPPPPPQQASCIPADEMLTQTHTCVPAE